MTSRNDDINSQPAVGGFPSATQGNHRSAVKLNVDKEQV